MTCDRNTLSKVFIPVTAFKFYNRYGLIIKVFECGEESKVVALMFGYNTQAQQFLPVWQNVLFIEIICYTFIT